MHLVSFSSEEQQEDQRYGSSRINFQSSEHTPEGIMHMHTLDLAWFPTMGTVYRSEVLCHTPRQLTADNCFLRQNYVARAPKWTNDLSSTPSSAAPTHNQHLHLQDLAGAGLKSTRSHQL